jgi:hypothetical protein
LVDEFDISFGFDVIKGWFESLEVKIPLKRAQLVLSMLMSQPMIPQRPVAAAVNKAYDLNLAVKVDIDFGQIAVNPEYYWETPLSNLTSKALQKTFQQLAKQAKGKTSAWNAWVYKRPKYDEIVMTSGSLAGVKVGDEFKIYNVEHIWTGTPCESEYVMPRKTTRQPMAVARVEQVKDHYSLMRFIPPYADTEGIEISEGAIVEISQLVPSSDGRDRELGRSLRIGEFTSGALLVKEKPALDLVPLMLRQLKPVVLDEKFVIW